MADGTVYATKGELIDAIKSLIFTNATNEVSADDDQTAMLNIVETLHTLIDTYKSHSNLENLDNLGDHNIVDIGDTGLSTIVNQVITDSVIVRKDNQWVKITIEEIFDLLTDTPLVFSNKTISASTNTLDITLDDVAETANNKYFTSTNKTDMDTLTGGPTSNADTLHSHYNIAYSIKTIEELTSFLEDDTRIYGTVLTPLTIPANAYSINGEKRLTGEKLTLSGVISIASTDSTINIYIKNDIVLSGDTYIQNQESGLTINLYTNIIYSNSGYTFTLGNSGGTAINLNYSHTPYTTALIPDGAGITIARINDIFQPKPVTWTVSGTNYVLTTTIDPNNKFSCNIRYNLALNTDFTVNLLPQVSGLLCRFEGYEDAVEVVNSAIGAGNSWNIDKFYNNTTGVTQSITVLNTAGSTERFILNYGSGVEYIGSGDAGLVNLTSGPSIFTLTSTETTGDQVREVTIWGSLFRNNQ